MLWKSDSEISVYDNCDEEKDIIAGSEYAIPLFWLGLFTEEDIRTDRIEMAGGSFAECPNLVVAAKLAKERAVAGKNEFMLLLPENYRNLYDLWLKTINEIDVGYIHMEMSEIWEISNDSELFLSELKTALNTISNKKLDILNFKKYINNITGLEIEKGNNENIILSPKKKEEIISVLCGFSWIKEVIWEKA